MAEEKITEETLNEEKQKKAVKVIEETVEKSKEQEYLERLQRLQAEFENYQKRTEKEKQENLINANSNIIFQLLEVLDTFELALKHNKDLGVQLIYDDLTSILKKHGLKSIDASGVFNPKLHEAVIKVGEDKTGVIIEELQKGYLLNNKLLRASKVKIGKETTKNE